MNKVIRGRKTKIYFAPNWGLSSRRIVQDYIKQTPGSAGVWNNLTYTLNLREADYLIIQDQCKKRFLEHKSPDKILYFSREAMTPQIHKLYPPDQVIRNSFWDGTNILWTKWWYPKKSAGGVCLTYDELIKEINPPRKDKILSSVQSDKRMSFGHILRHDFLGKFSSMHPDILDLYGPIKYANKKLPKNNKVHALDPYKYTLAFDNQNTIKSFFGTQFTDAILRWCVPIYWGGADLEKYFPKKSFLKIDIQNNQEKEICKIIDFVKSDNYESRIEDIKEARDLILNKYNMWPVIEEAIKG